VYYSIYYYGIYSELLYLFSIFLILYFISFFIRKKYMIIIYDMLYNMKKNKKYLKNDIRIYSFFRGYIK